MRLKLTCLILFCFTCVFSQDWTKRHQFAKSYFGISQFIVPHLTSGNYVTGNGEIQDFEKNGFLSPAINIGATHFWGYADLYVSISTADIKLGKDTIENNYRLGTFT